MRLGFYYTLSVPYVAGLACYGWPAIGGFRPTGWVFAVMLAAAPVVYLTDRTPNRFPMGIWMPWILIVILSLTWAGRVDLGSIQYVCQILTPFVIAPIASKATKSEADLSLLLRSFKHCVMILCVGVVLRKAGVSPFHDRPMAMTAALVGCVFLSQFRTNRLAAVTGWGACLLIAGLTGSRMATLALLLEWLLLPNYRRHIHRFVLAVLIAALSVALFYTPVFQERFFPETGGTLQDLTKGEFSSTGRFEVWEVLVKEIARRPFFGAGADASSRIVEQVWGFGIDKPHNDYLRILIEQGTIGLSIFLLGVMCQITSLWNRRFPLGDQRVVTQSAAHLGMLVFLILAMTDNPLAYGVWFMHPLFVLIGVSYSKLPISTENRI